jgi:hypothetical protein
MRRRTRQNDAPGIDGFQTLIRSARALGPRLFFAIFNL